ncbi:MAG: hypothetical protein LBU91_04430 [Bacteroidales bacterium]|nr:hypothetical protein [Bacteroidales bacterium]
MKKLLLLSVLGILFSTAVGQSVCPTSPDFTDLKAPWVVCNYGRTDNPFQDTGIMGGRHTRITGHGLDPNTGNRLPMIPEGDSVSIRLGNQYTGAQAEAITYNFTVEKDKSLLSVKFAVVLEDPGHILKDQPRFIVRILNDVDELIDPCAEYDITATAGIPGFETYNGRGCPIRWRPWTTVALDLSHYIGQNIKVQFVTYDCKASGHFGYAYFTAECLSNKLDLTCSSTSDTVELNAPPFCESYAWTNGDTTTSSKFVYKDANPIAASCLITSVTGCQFTLNAYVSDDVPFTKDTTIYDTICEGESYAKNDFDLSPQSKIGTFTHINSLYDGATCSGNITALLNLTVIQRFTYFEKAICYGEDYIENGFNFSKPDVGIWYDTVFPSGGSTCDAVFFLKLTVSPSGVSFPKNILGNAKPCTGEMETYTLPDADLFTGFNWIIPESVNIINSRNLSQIALQFTYETPADTLKLYAENGCEGDTLQLFVEPQLSHYLPFEDSICTGSAYNENDFNIPRQDSAGVYTFVQKYSTLSGCDSTRTLYLYVFPTPEIEIQTPKDVICIDDSVELNVVSNSKMVDLSRIVQIGDILCTDETVETPESFPASGKTAQGVIYWINPERTQCWVADITLRVNHEDNLDYIGEGCWGDTVLVPGVVTNLALAVNLSFIADTAGYQNTLAMRAAIDSLDDFGSTTAAWSVEFHNGWFLPAAGQMKVLFANSSLIYKSFEIAGGGQPFVFGAFDAFAFAVLKWWTSTQQDEKNAFVIDQNGTLVAVDKHAIFFTWQIRYFDLVK